MHQKMIGYIYRFCYYTSHLYLGKKMTPVTKKTISVEQLERIALESQLQASFERKQLYPLSVINNKIASSASDALNKLGIDHRIIRGYAAWRLGHEEDAVLTSLAFNSKVPFQPPYMWIDINGMIYDPSFHEMVKMQKSVPNDYIRWNPVCLFQHKDDCRDVYHYETGSVSYTPEIEVDPSAEHISSVALTTESIPLHESEKNLYI